MKSVVILPTPDRFKQEAALERDTADLISVFRELHEIERMTGRTGLSARVRISVMNIISSADKVAKEVQP